MYYSIRGLSSIFDVVAYTVNAMKKVGFIIGDIEEYLHEVASASHNLHIIELSKDKLKECNSSNIEIEVTPHRDWFEDTWRDKYYSSLWDDDERYNKSKWDGEDDTYDYLTVNKKSHNIWDDDNVFNDLKGDDEEAYEGFSSCKSYYLDSNDIDYHSFDEMVYDPWYEDN